jgi:PAS domain S-box-containing protein
MSDLGGKMQKQSLRLLLIEDSEDDYLLINRVLSRLTNWDITVEWATHYERALERMILNQHHVYLLDYRLNETDGLDLLQEARTQGCRAPIIMLTGSGAYESDVIAMQRGAADYLDKGQLSAVLLERSIRYALERKRSEELLQKQEKRFRALIENSADVVMLLDETGIILYSSPSATRVLGYTTKELEGYQVLNIVHHQQLEYGQATLDQLTKLTEGTISGEFYIRKKNGDYRWVEAIGANLLDEPGVGALVVNYRDITERKEAEEALKENEERFRKIFHASPVAISVAHLESGYILDVNDSFVNLVGYSREDLIGHTTPELNIHAAPERRPAMIEALQREGHVYDFEFRLRAKSGEIREVLLSLEVFNFRGERCVITMAHDITERKQAEAALKAKTDEEHEFQKYLKVLHEITIELTHIEDLDEFYKLAIEFGLQRLGFERLGLMLYDQENSIAIGTYGTDAQGNLLDEHDLRFNPTDLTGILMRSLQRKELFALDESALLYSNHKVIGTGWNAAAVLWNGTEKLGWLAADNAVHHKPVTKPLLDALALYALSLGTLIVQKRTQLALKESEAQYRGLFNQIEDSILIHDSESNILDVNQATSERLGYSRDELLRMKTLDIDSPTYGAKFYDRLKHQIESGKLLNIDGVHIARDGHQIPIYVNSRAITYKGQTAVLAVARDATELKRAEQRELELRTEKARVRVLADFIRDASHDFRTPLAAIGTSAYLLFRAVDQEKRQPYLVNIERRIVQMTNLIDRLFLMARLDAGTELVLENVKIAPVLQEIYDRFAPIAQEKGVHLALQVPHSLPIISVEKYELSRAIGEIMDNAIAFTPNEGTVTLRVEALENALVIEVQDTGEGVPPDALPHIFKRLYRGDEARSTERGAVGLGLSIAEKIIEAHNGYIEVASEVGSGSIFRIFLPLSS